MAGEKTEKATSKRRREQRKKGNVVQSQDIVSALVLLSIFGMLKLFGSSYVSSIATGMVKLFNVMDEQMSGGKMKTLYALVIIIAGQVALPIMLVNTLVSIILTVAQTRFLFIPLKFDFSRVSPIKGIKNLISLKSLVEVFKSILKIAIIGAIMYNEISPRLPQLMALFGQSLQGSMSYISQLILDVCIKASIGMLMIGVADYFYQWWDYERRIKMSKQEVKDEFKETEGNPEIKGRIRSEQRRLSRMRMMSAVPKADVVIRNPTHYAVALKYDKNNSGAPVVVAKGKNNVALKIVEIAQASKVYITENVPLAQALYKTVEVGQEIPAEFYKAVAEILAYIYKLRRAGRE